MPIQFDTAKLTVQLNSKEHNIGEIWTVMESLDNLSMSGFWATILSGEINDENILQAREILSSSMKNNRKNGRRFFPSFVDLFDIEMNKQRDGKDQLDLYDFPSNEFFSDFDSNNSLDTSVMAGMNSWVRKEILLNDKDLFNELFGKAIISKLEHHSPLLIELALIISTPLLPIIMTYGIMRAVTSHRKMEIENKIRDNERKIKEEEYQQKKIQTKILEEIYSVVKEESKNGEFRINEKVIENAAKISVSTVSDLNTNPFINSVTFGVTTKT